MKPRASISLKSRAAWRAWLERHHQTRAEVWVVYFKKHTGKPSVTYAEAVEEALCFGWIDGQVQRLDDERHAQRFTPRRKGSLWSPLNLRRFARLVEEGRVTDAGRAAGPKPGTRVAPTSWHRPDTVPVEVRARLKKSPKAWANLMAMAPSYRKKYVHYIDSAKRPETRERRAVHVIGMLERNEKPSMEFPKKERGPGP
jgi:uncharacterized protein YdeI (YjbR/CyaY-like superfamily)